MEVYGSSSAGGSGSSSSNFAKYLGTGIDGAFVFDGTNTYTNITKSGNTYLLNGRIDATAIEVKSGITVAPANFPIFCTGTFTIDAGGVIDAGQGFAGNAAGGNAAAAGIGGLGTWSITSNDLFAIVPGSAGSKTLSVAPTAPLGGYWTGGKGGIGGTGTSGHTGASTGTPSAVNGSRYLTQLPEAIWGAMPGRQLYPIVGGSGGSGGGGDTTNGGGGGGGGGCLLIICANALVNNGIIYARGGNGGNATTGSSAGGGGGGGGTIVTNTLSTTTGSGTYDVAGGTAGTSVGSFLLAATAGATGTVIHNVWS